jgi:hypothetical protein
MFDPGSKRSYILFLWSSCSPDACMVQEVRQRSEKSGTPIMSFFIQYGLPIRSGHLRIYSHVNTSCMLSVAISMASPAASTYGHQQLQLPGGVLPMRPRLGTGGTTWKPAESPRRANSSPRVDELSCWPKNCIWQLRYWFLAHPNPLRSTRVLVHTTAHRDGTRARNGCASRFPPAEGDAATVAFSLVVPAAISTTDCRCTTSSSSCAPPSISSSIPSSLSPFFFPISRVCLLGFAGQWRP